MTVATSASEGQESLPEHGKVSTVADVEALLRDSIAPLTAREALDKAVALHQGGGFKASIPYYIHAVRTDVAAAKLAGRKVDPDILHASGVALAMGGKRKEAIEFLEAALLNGKHQSGAVWSALALAYVESRELGKAERCYRAACKLNPTSAANWTGYANLAYCGGAFEIGEQRYQKALGCPATDPEELIAQGMTYLRMGHWRKGWRAYEARAVTAMWADRNPHAVKVRDTKGSNGALLPQMTYWRRPTASDHLLILTEQGFGDAMQFARYVPTLIERFGCRVTVQAHDALVELLQGGLPVPVQGRKAAYPEDLTGWALMLSLPAILHETQASVVPPSVHPFGLQWQPRERTGPLRVFVHGRGNAQHGYDQDRSSPGTLIEDMVRAAGHEVVQTGFTNLAAAGQAQVLAEPSWRDTVDRLLTCDRCLTVDTGLAHVAGSLGTPMDLIPPTIPEWRWGKPNAERTPWYPSARLWHRTRTEKWAECLAQVIQSWEG